LARSKRWILTAVVVALVVAMAAQVVSRREELDQIGRLSTTALATALVFQLTSQLLWNGSALLPLRMFVATIGFWELFMIRMGGFLVGSVVPVAGNFGVRMAYLKRHGVSYADFTWTTILVSVIGLMTGALLAAAGVAMLFAIGDPSLTVLALTLAVLAGSAAAVFVAGSLPRLASHPWLQRWLTRWPQLNAVAGFTADRRTIVGVSLLSFLRHVCSFVVFGVLYDALSDTPNGFLTGGLTYAISSPIRVVTLTPGNNLGLNEWVGAITGKALAFDVTTGLIVGLLYRGVSLVSQVTGVLLGGLWLFIWGER
jgi:hypothetical protein